MGQSITRANEHSAVPGITGAGERPMIGVGREGGACLAPEEQTAPIRRKQTLGDQHPPTKPPDAISTSPKNSETDEQKGFRGRLHKGWLTTIGAFHRNHDTTSGTAGSGDDTVSKQTDDTTMKESVSAPSSPRASSKSSSSSPSPSLSLSTPQRNRSLKPSSTTTTTGSPSPIVTRPRSASTTAESTSWPTAVLPHKNADSVDGPKQQHKPKTANEMTVDRIVAGKITNPIDEQQNPQPPPETTQKPHITTSPRGGIHDTSTTGGMSLWWRNHHPKLQNVMPPSYASGNTQPDELHREPRDPTYQSSNPMEGEPNSPSISKGGMIGSFDEAIPPSTMKPHVTRNVSGGMTANQKKASLNRRGSHDEQQEQPPLGGYVRDHDSLNKGIKQYQPPMISPWNTQPDELHREPRWRIGGHTTGKAVTSTGGDVPSSGSSASGGGSGVRGYSKDNHRVNHHDSHNYWWPPGGKMMQNNLTDQHNKDQPGGWPMNP